MAPGLSKQYIYHIVILYHILYPPDRAIHIDMHAVRYLSTDLPIIWQQYHQPESSPYNHTKTDMCNIPNKLQILYCKQIIGTIVYEFTEPLSYLWLSNWWSFHGMEAHFIPSSILPFTDCKQLFGTAVHVFTEPYNHILGYLPTGDIFTTW
jgi:hypothetical protein